MMTSAHHFARVFIELGGVSVGLAVLARVSSRWGFSSIPLYLLAGLAFGKGGLVPLDLSKDFIQIGAEIGVLLLLFMLGLEYSEDQLKQHLRSGFWGGALDLLLNFPPGFIAGLLLGWKPLAAILLGGVTYISSSGIAARILSELGRMEFPETSTVISILVIEDLVMAIYLPVVAASVAGGGTTRIVISVAIGATAVILALFAAVRYGGLFSTFIAHESDEVILLTTFGCVLLVAGLFQSLQVSAAIGAFLVGIAVSGPIAEQSHRLLSPLRDLFAAIFFFFFGLEVDPRGLPPVLYTALALGLISVATKILTGYWATRTRKLEWRARLRAGFSLVAHGEFSIVIAGLGVAVEPRLASLSAAYVLLLAVLGPIVARIVR